MNTQTCKRSSGFSIVELVVVVVVIAVLALVSAVAYSGLQARANDARRKSDMQVLARAIKLYELEQGNLMNKTGDCGYDGAGWVSKGAYGGRSIIDCLQSAGIDVPDLVDPSGCRYDTGSCSSPTTHAYLKLNCVDSSGHAYIYVVARLQSESQTVPSDFSLCQYASSWRNNYRINYFVKVE